MSGYCTNTFVRSSPLAGTPGRRTGGIVRGLMRRAAVRGREIVAAWRQRNAYRAVLATMGERELRDIGLNAYEAGREAKRPFWLGPVRRD